MILGLSGYARTGKDEVAKVLTEEFGFTRLAFADKLRQSVYVLNPSIVWDYKYGLAYHAKSITTLQEAIDKHGWDGVKSTGWGKAVRELLQRMGTEVGRNTLGQNIWVESTFSSLNVSRDYVITDCRFQNEAKAITNLGGLVVRVTRPGVGPLNDHISETDLDDWIWNAKIDNDGSLTDLKESVRVLYETIQKHL